MAFIGESRKNIRHLWHTYLCLDKEDCEILLEAIEKEATKIMKRNSHYKDIVESGEASSKQQDKYVETQESFEKIENILNTVKQYLNFMRNI